MTKSIGRRAILISGPTSGLGLHLSQLFSRRESPLLLVGRNLGRLDAHIDIHKANVYAIETDLASVVEVANAQKLSSAILAVLAKVKPDSISVICNAGVVNPIGCGAENDITDMVGATAVNFLAPVLMTSTCVNYAKEHSLSLSVLNISSGAATRAIPGWGAYCSTKAAARMYFDVLASEGAPCVSVKHFDPGVMDTQMQTAIRASNDQYFPLRGEFVQLQMQGKLKSPLEVAKQIEAMILALESA